MIVDVIMNDEGQTSEQNQKQKISFKNVFRVMRPNTSFLMLNNLRDDSQARIHRNNNEKGK